MPPVLLRLLGGWTSRSSIVLLLLVMASSSCRSAPAPPPYLDRLTRVPLHWVEVDGHRTAYLDIGQGPVLLFLHGYGGSMWQWEYQHELAQTHRLIILDFLGAGLTDKPNIRYTPEELVAFLRAFMDALHIPRATLVGNSLGAGIAIGMALRHSERVDRLVLISGFPPNVRANLTSPLLAKALDNWLPIWLVELGGAFTGRNVSRAVLREMIYDQTLVTPLIIERSHVNRKRGGMLRPLLTMAKNLEAWEQGFARRLHEITQPTLIVWGQQDVVFPPTVGQALQAVIPRSRIELVPQAGHIPMWERPDLVNPLLETFCAP